MGKFEEYCRTLYGEDTFEKAVAVLSKPYHCSFRYEDEICDVEAARLTRAVHDMGLYWSNGVTKVVVISDKYVLKTKISGSAMTQKEKTGYLFEIGEDVESVPSWMSVDYDEDGNPLFFLNDAQDYCAIEYEVYQRAKREGVADFFAATVKINDFVYAQERYEDSCIDVEVDEDLLSDFFKSARYDDVYEYAKEVGLGYLFQIFELDIFACFCVTYPIEELKKLEKFIQKYCINDLHSGNLGWFNGKIKLVDYSGYGSRTPAILKQKD